MGVIDVLQGHYAAALPHLMLADPEDPYGMLCQDGHVAVLPFEKLNPDVSDQYLAESVAQA